MRSRGIIFKWVSLPICISCLIIFVGALILTLFLLHRTSTKAHDLPEFAHRDANETPIGKEFYAGIDQVGVLLPDGKKIIFRRNLTHSGFFDESVKTLIVKKINGEKVTLNFGEGHSGYNAIEIRCSEDLNKIWIIDVSARHLYSGAAINLKDHKTYSETHGSWAISWARPDRGQLVLRKRF